MSIITLTTDYGLKDHFVGALKGKILSEYSEASVIDISHHIDPFNTVEASYILGASFASFPKGTVHLIGVDMESNKENQHIVMQWNDHYFIAADNGILSMLSQKIVPQKMVAINIHDRLPSEATDLDVFVKVACHIAKGGLMNVIGKEIKNIKQVTNLQATISDDGNSLKGHVIYIDHFGNVVTNISKKYFIEVAKGRPYEIVLKTKNIKTILPNYSAIASSDKYPIKYYEGEKLAIFNEAGFLEIAIFRSNPSKVGSANSLLGLNYRDIINIVFR
ncbi:MULTISPECIES: SAM hydrolase/SAM-dependent halogenase family protein [Flavobacterium]|uniref:SAM-dependent chlorinase/fluorinase n=1 Tax=Flavobacterium gawalongense TaxID=2594432 RepID=A0A553BPK2_9FLAO|nr:SAM-dependent chlorinase/fluorinase [Flavobacterium gawalongense]TRX01587.1 SAM-dependent chlorinase/fluorinase [Flavobacterium gawalongense]TRX06062.1 SAM-dependent chlorinase/fluorinase [Flavobacterium gawalongense]TRX10183.1 SAM-dependent chlorinase/fluorinase [Flavobacterium gawalongense]TRX11196.1 SAM-dependent chlorinase/fluorinase [Flavobacterium gawalongense]TRX28845.1 SAM-dependent chlorinase/fluorinase [Flavobacterium gawalongense]